MSRFLRGKKAVQDTAGGFALCYAGLYRIDLLLM